MNYRLLDTFRGLFEGHPYLHRRSNLGDMVARDFYEDLFALGRSRRLIERVEKRVAVLNTQNARVGVSARRGDGSFGELTPGAAAHDETGYTVGRGPIATIEIGIEVKILFKAMIKQIDRVMNDLRKQVEHFRSKGGRPICVGIVGINFADHCTSHEGSRSFATDGKRYKHPIQEAADAHARRPRSTNFWRSSSRPTTSRRLRSPGATRIKRGSSMARSWRASVIATRARAEAIF